MTEIRAAGATPAVPEAQATDPFRNASERRTGSDVGLGRDMRFSTFARGEDPNHGREDAFARKMSHALGEIGAMPGQVDAADGLRLLAMAGGSPFHGSGSPAAEGVSKDEKAAPHVAEVSAIVDRVEAALAAQRVDAPVSGVSLKLDLGDLGGSIAGLTISLSPTAIDLVLTRSAGEAGIHYVEAAQALADRLHTRFARRTVRVLEVDDRPAQPGEGLGVISELLSRSAGHT